MSIAFDSSPARPSRQEIEPVALDLIRRRGKEVLSSARRYASSPDDAEDAYQRALEILLTKAPTTREDELLAWLKTVVRHECFALRKKAERDLPVEHEELDAYTSGESHAADARAERYDRLRVGAEALGRLKPQETKALLLKAEGMSYREIAATTGWTYTKVNRCLTEGRRAFVARVQGIETGAECQELEPLLSAMSDDEVSPDDLVVIRRHLRGCLSCKAKLRDYREAPARVRDLSGGGAAAGVFGWLGGRVWSAVRSLFETTGMQKAAVVATSTAVVAGGGAATVRMVESPASSERPPVERAVARPSALASRVGAAAPTAAVRVRPEAAREPKPRRKRPRKSGSAPQRQSVAPTAQTKPAPAAEPAPKPSPSAPSQTPSLKAPVAPDPAPAEPAADGEFGP